MPQELLRVVRSGLAVTSWCWPWQQPAHASRTYRRSRLRLTGPLRLPCDASRCSIRSLRRSNRPRPPRMRDEHLRRNPSSPPALPKPRQLQFSCSQLFPLRVKSGSERQHSLFKNPLRVKRRGLGAPGDLWLLIIPCTLKTLELCADRFIVAGKLCSWRSMLKSKSICNLA